MCDVTLTLQPQGVSGGADSVKYTVLWVGPIGVTFSGSVSTDNDKRENWKNTITANGTYDLGPEGFKQYTGEPAASLGIGYEEHALVFPINFGYPAGSVYAGVTFEFARKIQKSFYKGMNGSDFDAEWSDADLREENDPVAWQDDTPSVPWGEIYDLDDPRIYTNETKAAGYKERVRDDFEATVWVNIPGFPIIQCSDARQFHVCISIVQVDSPSGSHWVFDNEYNAAGDNNGGYGLLQYATWNLQPP